MLQHSSSQESCSGCRMHMTSSFTMVCIPHVCVICWVMLLGYSQMCCLLVYIICVCVKVVGNVVKDVGIGISLTATQVKELYF